MKNLKLNVIRVNLQEGLLVDRESIVGCYSHHNKVVAFTEYLTQYELPAEFNEYDVYKHGTDSIALVVYTDHGYKDLHDFKRLMRLVHTRAVAS